MKIKTSEATKLQLDWGVAVVMSYTQLTLQVAGKVYGTAPDGQRTQIKHTDPAVCMGLIERYKLQVSWAVDGLDRAYAQPKNRISVEWPSGDNLAQAVARCVIAMRLGDEFECPSELGVMS